MPRASVHWNLHKKTYSIAVSGQPVRYAEQVRMRNCVFHIDARLRAQFERNPDRRTVHALIRGEVVDSDRHARGRGEIVRCNPFAWAHFVRASDERHALSASEVILHPDRTIEVYGLVVADEPARVEDLQASLFGAP